MKKKILIFGALVALMLVTISFASVVATDTQTNRKESPLYSIRTKLIIGERLQNLKTKLIGERMFLPFQWLINKNDFLCVSEFDGSASVALTAYTCPIYCCK